MDSEFENKPQSQSSESENTREGFNAGGYQKSYRSVAAHWLPISLQVTTTSLQPSVAPRLHGSALQCSAM